MNNESNRNSRYGPKKVHSVDEIRTNESRTIKPLRPVKPCTLPIVAVLPDRSVVSEVTGQVLTFEQYSTLLRDMPPHLVVTYSADAWLWLLNERWKDHPSWRWQVMVQRKPHTKLCTYVSYYGFYRGGHAFANIVLDAASFTRDRDANLLELGQWIRDFCNTYGIRIRASAAGVAAQLLRHPMFYPEARRAVPKFINDTARAHLPGPFYESYVDSGQQIAAAMYVDQEAAYHYAAETTPLPDANSIQAYGHTRTTGIYARAGGELFQREMCKHGLAHVEAEIPVLDPTQERFIPRLLRKPGRREVWIWTNEIPYLESFGFRIVHLISVWGSTQTDTHIREYARWARDMSRDDPRLKALLLMPYGTLGKRPGEIEIHTPGGEDELLLCGHWIEGTRKRTANVQTFTANALQLGLIQAHVRALSLDMARQLSAQGKEVISVYADGIFVRLDETRQIPMFAPWRLKEEDLELHLTDSLRVPVRTAVRREYVSN